MQTEMHGGDIYTRPYRIDFSANINPLGTPPAVLEAACRGVSRAADYPDIHCRKLRQAISRREEVPADQIICGERSGGTDLCSGPGGKAPPGSADGSGFRGV